MTFTLRYRFFANKTFKGDATGFEFTLGGRMLNLYAQPGGELKKTHEFAVIGEGFESEDEAWSFGRKMRKAFLLMSVEHSVNFDLGEDQATLRIYDGYKREIFEQTGKQLRENVHGIDVYREDLPIQIADFRANISVAQDPDIFEEQFQREFDRNEIVSDVMERALEIFNVASYETSSVAKFLLSIAAIEALARRRKRGDDEIAILNEAKAFVENSFPASDAATSIVNALNSLVSESIGATCRRFIENELSAEKAAEFSEVYGQRSRVVHGNNAMPKSEVTKLAGVAHKIAKDLLLSKLQNPQRAA